MGKTPNTKPANSPENGKSHHTSKVGKKNKFAEKMKNKLKSALQSENSANKDLFTEAKTFKKNAKFNFPKPTQAANIKFTSNQSTIKPNQFNAKPKSFSTNSKNATRTVNDNQQHVSGKSDTKTYQKNKNKNHQEMNPQQSGDHAGKVNGLAYSESIKKNKKNKRKNKSKQSKKQEPTESPAAPLPNGQSSSKTKRNMANVNSKLDTGIKRLKTVAGFIETNANDEKQNKLIYKKLKKAEKKRSKLAKSAEKQTKMANDENAPKIKVHNVNERNSHDAENNSHGSDSEADSYIDKFFGDGDEDFDENRIYSMDELEAKNENGFLLKDSGGRNKSDESSPSECATTPSKVKSKQVNGQSKTASQGTAKTSPKNKLAKYEANDEDDSDEWDSMSYEDDESYSDEEDSDMYEEDSDASLGSEVIFSDDGESYDSESSDIESMEEYEDDMTYEESGSQSASSNDTYDDFVNRHGFDDGLSSSEDHEYTDEAYDDVQIARGTAVTYKITDKRIKMFENDTESRIVELPKSNSDDECCDELIPISVSRTKFQQIENEKKLAKEAELQKKKVRDERKQKEYEKSVADYYSMDDYNKSSTSTANGSVSIIKCSKKSNHLEWMDDSDGQDQLQDIDIESVYSKRNSARKIVVVSISPNRAKETAKNSEQILSKTQKNTEAIIDSDETSTHESASDQNDSDVDESMSSIETPAIQANRVESQFFNSVNSRHVLLLLRNTLHFHGSLHIKLIAGNAVVFGYELQPNKAVTVHSPRGHGLIYLSPSANGSSTKSNLGALSDLTGDFYVQDIEYLSKEFNGGSDAILLLERDQTNKGVNMIDRYMRETMFPNINAFNNESPFYSSEFVLHCKFLNSPENGLILNEQWSTLNLRNKSKIVTIGGKGAGKSTLVRYIINSNFDKFQKFLYIDLDIGQPELFVPQTLSTTVVTEPILGPGYLKNMKPAKAVLFGDINVLPNPIKYLRCVSDIFGFCATNPEFADIPWVINTMGYSRGFGTELIACILAIIKPTDLIQIQSRSHKENFDHIMDANVVNEFKFNVFEHEMRSIVERCRYKTHIFDTVRGKFSQKQTGDMNAKDLRYTMILAKLGNSLKCNSDWLTSVKPFEASLNDLDVIITSGEEVNPSDYLNLLNGNLVYLCGKNADNADDIVDCHGIGIVRSVDASTNKLYLLSTIPLNELHKVNVLAIGAIPLPSAVFLNQHSEIRGTVPYVYNSDKFVGSKQVAQHIFRAEKNRNNKQIQLMEEH